MKSFLDHVRDRLESVSMRDNPETAWMGKSIGVIAIVGAAAALPAAPGIALGVASFSAYKLSKRVIGSIFERRENQVLARMSEGLAPHLRDAVQKFAHDHNNLISQAVSNGDGMWLVREDRAKTMRVMDPVQFLAFENMLKHNGSYLQKVVIDEDKVTVTHKLGDKMYGDTNYTPAMKVLHANGAEENFFMRDGKMTRAPTEAPQQSDTAGTGLDGALENREPASVIPLFGPR